MGQPFYRGIDTERQIQEMNNYTKERHDELWTNNLKIHNRPINIDKALKKYDQFLRKEERLKIMSIIGI